MPRACIVLNLISVFFGKNVRILHVTGSILENLVRTRYRMIIVFLFVSSLVQKLFSNFHVWGIKAVSLLLVIWKTEEHSDFSGTNSQKGPDLTRSPERDSRRPGFDSWPCHQIFYVGCYRPINWTSSPTKVVKVTRQSKAWELPDATYI